MRLELAKVNGTYPERLQKLLGGPAFEGIPESVESIWRSATHLVILHRHDHCLVLEIRRTVLTDACEFEADPMPWSEVMAVKAEIGMADAWAVECYPPERHSLRKMQSRCLWIMENEPDFGWRLVQAAAPAISLSDLNGFGGHAADNDGIPPNVVDALIGRSRLMP